MDDDVASAHAKAIYDALIKAEAEHPGSRALAALHATLYAAWTDYHDAHPGTVQPFGGTDKPPPGP